MYYTLYYPEEGRYSKLMTLKMARAMAKHFVTACIIDARTAEIVY